MKVADFGVARVQSQSGVMTAETGTYRWMAPEVAFSSFVIIFLGLKMTTFIWCKIFPCFTV